MRKIVIDPRVIKHLGRDLITSPEVAIIELIKNSIDAKASHINLRLYNSMPSNELIPDCVSDSVPNKYLASPILVVEDDGCGMTDATIDGGFLKIATDIKSNEESTLGEKGIGRLAAQRLGTALLVETSSDKENHNRSCACSFRSARYVHNSPVSVNVFNLAGWASLKYSRCIRPYFPIGRCSSGSFKSGM